MAQVRLIVFDLDETLVHATDVALPCPHAFQIGPYFVYVRPFAADLIRFCASHFEIAVWSSSSERYVETVTTGLFGTSFPVTFSWAISKCVQKVDAKSNGYVYIKDLRKALKHGYAADEIIMIDDSPKRFNGNRRGISACQLSQAIHLIGNFLTLLNALRQWRESSQLPLNGWLQWVGTGVSPPQRDSRWQHAMLP